MPNDEPIHAKSAADIRGLLWLHGAEKLLRNIARQCEKDEPEWARRINSILMKG